MSAKEVLASVSKKLGGDEGYKHVHGDAAYYWDVAEEARRALEAEVAAHEATRTESDARFGLCKEHAGRIVKMEGELAASRHRLEAVRLILLAVRTEAKAQVDRFDPAVNSAWVVSVVDEALASAGSHPEGG